MLAIFILITVFASATAEAKTIFYEGSFESAQILAKQQNKLLVLDFTARWCLPCKWMEKNVYGDENFMAFAKRNAIVFKVDVDDLDGITIKQQYAVKLLPTVILIHPDGFAIDRKEESMNTETMIDWCTSKIQGQNLQFIPVIKETENEVKSEDIQLQEDIKTNEETNNEPSAEQDKSDITTNNVEQVMSELEKENSETEKPIEKQITETEFTELDEFIFTKGEFTLQLGAFSNFKKAESFAAEVEAKFQYPSEILEDFKDDGTPFYRLSCGNFETEEEAELFKTFLSEKGLKAIIKKI